MAGSKGVVGHVMPETLDMISRHGSATTAGVAAYFDIEIDAAWCRCNELRKRGLIVSEVSYKNGKQCVWRVKDGGCA